MYRHILSAALSERDASTAWLSLDEAWSELLVLHDQLPDGSLAGWSHTDVVDQIAYDTALIHLAQRHGIDWDINEFDQPHSGRARLQAKLRKLGYLDNPPEPDAGPALPD